MGHLKNKRLSQAKGRDKIKDADSQQDHHT